MLIRLTHANLNETVYVDTALLFAFHHSPNSEATHVISTGGAVLPVIESCEEIAALKNKAELNETKEKKK